MKYKINEWVMALKYNGNPKSLDDWMDVKITDATEDQRFREPIYTTNRGTYSESKLFTRPEFWEVIDGTREYK